MGVQMRGTVGNILLPLAKVSIYIRTVDIALHKHNVSGCQLAASHATGSPDRIFQLL